MNLPLSLRRIVPLFILVASLAAAPAFAQQPPGVMDSLNSLTQERASHTAFTFDRSELQFAERFIDSGRDGEAKRAVAALDSITVENYHYTRPAFYDPEVMDSIAARYRVAGWKHLVNANAHPGEGVTTDLWLHFHGSEIDDLTVLVRGQREMNLIAVAGTLRPLDLVHLSGHFGIPKVDQNAVMVPAPDGK
jgi:hypothetical protein